MTHHADIEGIARDIQERTGVEPPIDAFALAEILGYTTRPWGRAYSQLSGREIRYPANARNPRQHRQICHEIAHPALARAGEDDRDEEAADRVALALMLPQTAVRRDIARTDFDLFALLAIHVNVSAQAMAVRLCQLAPVAASIYDQGTRTALYLGEGALEDPDDDELASLALDREQVIRDGLVSAYPMIEGRFRRIVVVRRAA